MKAPQSISWYHHMKHECKISKKKNAKKMCYCERHFEVNNVETVNNDAQTILVAMTKQYCGLLFDQHAHSNKL